MFQTQIVLLVSAAPAVAELITRSLVGDTTTTVILEARSGADAIDVARAQPLGLVVLDLDLEGVVSAQALCVKLRALRPTLPILPIGTSVALAPLLGELGCAPAVAKSQLLANLSQLRRLVDDALQQEPMLTVPKGTFSYLLEQADAALGEERRQRQLAVLVRCRNVLLRCGLAHALTSLGMAAHLVAADDNIVPGFAALTPGARLVVGPLSDLEALQALAQAARLPLLLVALHEDELARTPYTALAGASLLLFDEAVDIVQFLTALQSVAAGTPFLAVPSGTIARWVAPMAGLTAREWQVIIALCFVSDYDAVAQVLELSPQTIETYAKRARQKLGARRLPEALALVEAYVTAELGIAPTSLRSSAELERLAS